MQSEKGPIQSCFAEAARLSSETKHETSHDEWQVDQKSRSDLLQSSTDVSGFSSTVLSLLFKSDISW